MTTQQIEVELLKLDLQTRARLAEKLLVSLEELSDAENDRLWAEEAARRHKELVNGSTSGRPAHEVLRDVRDALK